MATSLEKWITSGIDDECVKHAEVFAKGIVPENSDKSFGIHKDLALTSSQIRISFGEVRRIQQRTSTHHADSPLDAESTRSLALLRPKLAYATARASKDEKKGKTGAELLENELNQALNCIQATQKGATRRFQNFCDYFEAILAYHKKFGGKD